MSEVLQTNVFFMITSIVVVVIGLLMAIFLVYVIVIARNVSKFSETVRRETDEIIQDAHAFRSEIKSKASWLQALSFIFAYIRHKKKHHEK